MLKRIVDWIALTNTERKVILFLVITLLVGTCIRLFQTKFPSAPQFDYNASDGTFAALSAVPGGKEGIGNALGKLNINTATKQQLLDLPGRCSDSKSNSHISFRNRQVFRVDELRAIKGISKKKLENLRPFITIQ